MNIDNGGILNKKGYNYKDENGDEQNLPRAQVGLEKYKMTKEQTELQQTLLTKCIETYPGIDKHMHPEKLDKDNREESDYAEYIGEN